MTTAATIKRIKLADIRTDGGTQSRAALNPEVVGDYAHDLEEGATLPPVDVCYDGTEYHVFDGFHRVAANKQVGFVEIDAAVMPGTREDAVWHSCASNRAHDRAGLRRTNSDKRRQVETALSCPTGRAMSDNAIADHVGVAQSFVSKIRKERGQLNSEINSTEEPVVRTGRDGKQYRATVARKPKREPVVEAHDDEGEGPVEGATEPAVVKPERTAPIKESYSDGLMYAAMTISQLERIHPKDEQRQEALEKVAAWIEAAAPPKVKPLTYALAIQLENIYKFALKMQKERPESAGIYRQEMQARRVLEIVGKLHKRIVARIDQREGRR